MMRPTASSASKIQGKIETKSPPRLAKVSKPPRKSLGRDDAHSNGLSEMKAAEAPKTNGNLEVHREHEPDGIEEFDAVGMVEPTLVEQSPLAATVSNDPEAQEA